MIALIRTDNNSQKEWQLASFRYWIMQRHRNHYDYLMHNINQNQSLLLAKLFPPLSPEIFLSVLSLIENSLSTSPLFISVIVSKNYLKDLIQSSVHRFPCIFYLNWVSNCLISSSFTSISLNTFSIIQRAPYK